MGLRSPAMGIVEGQVGTLVDRCRDGDRDAWAELVQRYERLVYAIPIRSGLSSDDAADVAQTVFAELIRQLPSIREPERLTYWLMTVARRQTWRRLDLLRVEQSTADDLRIDLTDPDPFVDQSHVFDTVGSMTEPCRSLLLGLFADTTEPPYAEVARRIDRSVGSIGPMRQRCLGHLRVLLEEQS